MISKGKVYTLVMLFLAYVDGWTGFCLTVLLVLDHLVIVMLREEGQQ